LTVHCRVVSTPIDHVSRYRRIIAWPLAAYGVLATIAVVRLHESAASDAIAYVQEARRVVAGHPLESLSPYWSPLLPWTMAPLIRAGVDALLAEHIAIACWGGVLVAAAGAFLARRLALSERLSAVLLVVVALNIVAFVGRVASPDL